MKELKYRELIQQIKNNGCECPPPDSTIPNMEAYRYVFENDVKKINHLPGKVISPKRALKDDIENCSYCGLSCYDTEINAITNYNNLIASIPLIYKNIGDSLSKGKLSPEVGIVTSVDNTGHFDLYEHIEFDPHSNFNFIKNIYNDGSN